MITSDIRITDIVANRGQVPGLPSNPRQWTRADLDRLKTSITETPELLDARGILVYPYKGKYIIIGGNMRFAACKELNMPAVPCIILDPDTPADKLRELVVKDNGAFGSWDYDMLANEWDDLPLLEWGVPSWVDDDEMQPENKAAEANKEPACALTLAFAEYSQMAAFKSAYAEELKQKYNCKIS